MPLIYTAIVPHPPLLIPSIGKNAAELLKITAASYKKIEEDLYACEPETIIIISPHGTILPGAFSMNLAPVFTATFEEFGDFGTKKHYSGNIGLAHKLKECLESSISLQLVTSEKLDYGSAIPLMLAAEQLNHYTVIPIYFSEQGLKEHFEFGKVLQKHLQISMERIAVIASADLSHALTKKSPAGYSPKGKKFDKKIMDLLIEGKSEEILNLDETMIRDACECGLKSIVILSGIISGLSLKPQLLSYEAPAGVGYMVMRYLPRT